MRVSLLAAVLLSGCAAMGQPKVGRFPDLTCEQREAINSWNEECLEWARQRDADRALKEKAAARAREEHRARQMEQQAKQMQEAERLEAEAIKKDKDEGYKAISFEDFFLDAPNMKGAKVAVRGFYVATGERLIRDPMSAARYVSTGESVRGINIPLLTETASREARASFLRCNNASAPLGCGMVVRGRVRSLTLRNDLGVERTEVGIVVESIRP